MITVSAATLARAWLSVATAASTKPDEAKIRPQLHRTVQISQHAHGLRLASTDALMLLHAWVPEVDYELDPEPGLDDTPYASAVVIDEYGRGAGLLAHLLRLASDEDKVKRLDVTVALNVDFDDATADPKLDGLTALAVTISWEDNERLQLPVYEGGYVNWQSIVGKRTGRSGTVALAQWIAARLAKAAKPHGDHTTIKCWLGGRNKPITVAFGHEPEISGLVMPARWDFDKGRPYGQADRAAEEDRSPLQETGVITGDTDDLLEVARALVIESQLGSTSMLQRKLRISHARAVRLIDLLENAGVIGPADGQLARPVLMTIEELPK